MRLQTDSLQADLVALLGDQVDVVPRGDLVAVLTPADYPDGDGVVVQVAASPPGYLLSDAGQGDARLLVGGPGPRTMGPLGGAICRRFGASFDGGRVIARVASEDEIADGCWRVAQASVAIAEAATYHRPSRPRERELVDVVAASITSKNLSAERERELAGASGHSYKASIYVPEREAVIEPIGGEKPWNVASAVYVEFGDLRGVNGFQLVSVLDDRYEQPSEDVERLLRQVSIVGRLSQASEWLAGLARNDLL